jgi:hypothetical protein
MQELVAMVNQHAACVLQNAGTTVSYAFDIVNNGNVKLRGVQLLVPALAGSSNDSSLVCAYADSTIWTHGSDLAAGGSLSCSGAFSFSQDSIEAGDLSPAVTATAANLAAAVTQPLPAISVPNSPSLSITVDTSSCTRPESAGGCMLLASCFQERACLLLLQLRHAVM